MNVKTGTAIATLTLLTVGCASNAVESAQDGEFTEQEAALLDSAGRALSPLSAEIVRANQAAEINAHLVARIEVQENELLEFYEVSPGVLVISGAGAPVGSAGADQPLEWTPEGLDESWAKLAGAAPVPDTLREAITRSAEYTPTDRGRIAGSLAEGTRLDQAEIPALPASPEGAAPELNLRHNTGGSSYCESGYYTTVINGYYTSKPQTFNLSSPPGASSSAGFYLSSVYDHRTGTITRSYGNSSYMRTSVCAVRGQVLFTVRRNGGMIEMQVPQGTMRWATYWGGWGCDVFDTCGATESKVSQATDDEYHYRYQVQSG